MAPFDCCTATPQPVGYTHIHIHTHADRDTHGQTLSAITQLATVCVLLPSLLQASRSALRQGKQTHTHTHYLPRSTPIFFGREETRREQMQGSAAFFASEELLLNPDFQADDSGISFLALKVLSKIFGSIIITKGICSTRQDCRPMKIRKEKRNLDLCTGFWRRQTCDVPQLFGLFLLDDEERRQEGCQRFPASPKNTPTATESTGLSVSQPPPVCHHCWSHRNLTLSFQDIDAAGPGDCAESVEWTAVCSGIQPGELSSSRHKAQTSSPSRGGREGERWKKKVEWM